MDIKKDNQMYMTIAHIASERSYAKRLKVGCVIVKNHSIISFGWNGMPTGYDNCCEYEVDGKLVTRPEVQHAELNAIAKLAQNGYSSNGASIFITRSPCIHCALLIQKCGITEVYYHRSIVTTPVLNFLKRRALRLSSYKRPYFTYLKNRLGGQSKSIAFFRTPTTYLEADRSGKGQAHT